MGDFFGHLGSLVNSAFDPGNHGVLDGNWGDFQLGINRAFGLPTQIISNNVETFGHSIGNVEQSLLSPLSANPAFYILAGGGIIVLLIVGYTVYKVGRYV